MIRLRGTVAAIDDDVSSSSVAGGITGEIQEGTLELFRFTFTAHWDLGLPEIVSLLGDEVRDLSGNVTGRDGVGTGELRPLNGERFDYIKGQQEVLCSSRALISPYLGDGHPPWPHCRELAIGGC